MTRYAEIIETPIGLLTLVVDGSGAVKHLDFGKHEHLGAQPDPVRTGPARTQIQDYFAGTRRMFELELAPDGTAFQRAVWAGLLTIPFGETISYGELAARVGRSGAFRAVGAANGSNPIPLIIPCHRVIGSDGALTGFGGGIPIKAALLAHEGVLPAEVVTVATRRTKVGPVDRPHLV